MAFWHHFRVLGIGVFLKVGDGYHKGYSVYRIPLVIQFFLYCIL